MENFPGLKTSNKAESNIQHFRDMKSFSVLPASIFYISKNRIFQLNIFCVFFSFVIQCSKFVQVYYTVRIVTVPISSINSNYSLSKNAYNHFQTKVMMGEAKIHSDEHIYGCLFNKKTVRLVVICSRNNRILNIFNYNVWRTVILKYTSYIQSKLIHLMVVE